MRLIKFRGKRVDNLEWVYGCLVNNLWVKSELTSMPRTPVCEIISDEGEEATDWCEVEYKAVEVIPESVGQWTTHQIKGVDLYEGDIVRIEENEEGVDPEDRMTWYVCTWIQEWCMFALLRVKDEYPEYKNEGVDNLDTSMFWTFPLDLQDIGLSQHYLCGNVHSNPELLSK